MKERRLERSLEWNRQIRSYNRKLGNVLVGTAKMKMAPLRLFRVVTLVVALITFTSLSSNTFSGGGCPIQPQ